MLQGMLGLLVFVLTAWLCSENRHKFPWKLVATGLMLQLLVAFLLLKLPVFQSGFLFLSSAVLTLEAATRTGTTMVFGYLGGGDPRDLHDRSDRGLTAVNRTLIVLFRGGAACDIRFEVGSGQLRQQLTGLLQIESILSFAEHPVNFRQRSPRLVDMALRLP